MLKVGVVEDKSNARDWYLNSCTPPVVPFCGIKFSQRGIDAKKCHWFA